MAAAWAVNNLTYGLAETAFAFTGGPGDATRLFLNDGRIDRQYSMTTAGVSSNIWIDLGSAKEVRGFAVLNHSMASASAPIFSCEAGDSVDLVTNYILLTGVSNPVPQTPPAHRDFVVQFNTGVSRRYWRINLAWTGTHQLKVGEVFLYGAPNVLTRGFTDGSGEAERFVTAPVQMRNGGQRVAFIAGPLRDIRLRMRDYTSANKAELLTMFRAANGGASPLLWVPTYSPGVQTAATEDCMLAQLQPEFSWDYTDFDLTQPPDLLLRGLGRAEGQ